MTQELLDVYNLAQLEAYCLYNRMRAYGLEKFTGQAVLLKTGEITKEFLRLLPERHINANTDYGFRLPPAPGKPVDIGLTVRVRVAEEDKDTVLTHSASAGFTIGKITDTGNFVWGPVRIGRLKHEFDLEKVLKAQERIDYLAEEICGLCSDFPMLRHPKLEA
jgi:hypothetical protein